LVPIVIVVSAAVTPSPILFLFLGRKLAKVSVFVAVVVAGPLVVVDNFIIVPNVVVAVVEVIDSVAMFGACRAHYRKSLRTRRTQELRMIDRLSIGEKICLVMGYERIDTPRFRCRRAPKGFPRNCLTWFFNAQVSASMSLTR
jgi:hypothetical protein